MSCAIETTCQHFKVCGGCQFQNLPYEIQLEQKQSLVEELFGRSSSIIGCDDPWKWRNKMEFSFSQNKAGDHFLGLMMRGKRGRVVTLNECLITNSWFIDVLTAVRLWWEASSLPAYFAPLNKGALRTLTLREGVQTGEKMAMLTISGDYPFDQENSFVDALSPFGLNSIILRRQIIQKGTPTRFEESVLQGSPFIHEKMYNTLGEPLSFKVRPSSFFQPNTLQAEKLIHTALELGALSEKERLLDLCCGIGTIGLMAAPLVQHVTGIEVVHDSVIDCKENILNNKVSNMNVFERDMGDLEEIEADTVVVDPPRAGLTKQAIEGLLRISSQKIIYISCHPLSQKKNIEALEGYEVVEVQPVDQFPHTKHLENIVILEKL